MQPVHVPSRLSGASQRALRTRSCLRLESRSFHATRQWREDSPAAKGPRTPKQASSPAGIDLRSLATPAIKGATGRPLIRRTGAPELHLRDAKSAGASRPAPPQHSVNTSSMYRPQPGAGRGGQPFGGRRAPAGGKGGPPRKGRGRDGGGERRGPGGRGGAGAAAEEDEQQQVTQAMLAYRADKTAAQRAAKPFAPQGVSLEELQPFAPKMPIGVENAVQMLRHRMNVVTDPHESVDATRVVDLANRLRAGKYVYFRSEAEKKQVVEEARRGEERKLGWLKADGKSEDKADVMLDVEGLTEASRKAVEAQLFDGKYPPINEQTKNDKIDSIMHLVRKNGTYHSEDEKKLFAKLGSLLPAARTAAKGNAARK